MIFFFFAPLVSVSHLQHSDNLWLKKIYILEDFLSNTGCLTVSAPGLCPPNGIKFNAHDEICGWYIIP